MIPNLLFWIPYKSRKHIETVRTVTFFQIITGQCSQSGQQVHIAEQHIGRTACRYFARPSYNHRNPMTTLPSLKFETKQFSTHMVAASPSLLSATIHHRPVITGKYEQGIICQPFLFKCLHDLTDNPIQLMNGIAVRTGLTATDKTFGRSKGVMNIGRCIIQKERFVLMSLNPFHGLILQGSTYFTILVETMGGNSTPDIFQTEFLIKLGSLSTLAFHKRIIRSISDHVMVFHIYKRRMAVQNGYTEIIVKSKFQRPGVKFFVPVHGLLGLKPQMPLSDNGRCIS